MDGRRDSRRWVLHSRGPCAHAWLRGAKPGDPDCCLLCGERRIKPEPAPLTAADVEEWT